MEWKVAEWRVAPWQKDGHRRCLRSSNAVKMQTGPRDLKTSRSRAQATPSPYLHGPAHASKQGQASKGWKLFCQDSPHQRIKAVPHMIPHATTKQLEARTLTLLPKKRGPPPAMASATGLRIVCPLCHGTETAPPWHGECGAIL